MDSARVRRMPFPIPPEEVTDHGNERIIERLNARLADELTAINQ
jgi:hypothetical protein